tara:strand:+ start:1853 stop:2026 length:174 start_codon:yes stop_codon:yes gene_type:complete
MFNQARFEEIVLALRRARDSAQDAEFQTLWRVKLEEFQRTELLEISLRQQEGKIYAF